MLDIKAQSRLKVIIQLFLQGFVIIIAKESKDGFYYPSATTIQNNIEGNIYSKRYYTNAKSIITIHQPFCSSAFLYNFFFHIHIYKLFLELVLKCFFPFCPLMGFFFLKKFHL